MSNRARFSNFGSAFRHQRNRMGRQYGIIVFGATGFTGKRVMVEMANSAPGVKWAAAGRNQAKLEEALKDAGLVGIDTVIADTGDEASMNAMCSKADLVINCTGPFRFHGEAVVKACVESATHYVDITGEPEFMEKMELEYMDSAKEKKVYIVNGCGFDSVPADEGMAFTKEQFHYCAFAESFLLINSDPSIGYSAHATTFECVVHGVGAAGELKEIRKKLADKRPTPVPFLGNKLKVKDLYSEKRCFDGAYVARFPGADASVVRRSELYRSAADGKPQSQYGAYMVLGSMWNAARLGFHQKVIESVISFDAGKKFVLEHPDWMTAGVFSHKGPTEEQMAKASFEFTFLAEGYSDAPADGGEYDGKPDLKVTVKVSGPEPGYVATPIFVVAAAATILSDGDKMGDGGVLTPSLAFKGTGYRQRLISRGIKFSVV